MRIPLLQEAKTSELVCPLKKLNKPHGKPEMTLKLGQFSIEKEGPDQDPRYKSDPHLIIGLSKKNLIVLKR